MRLMDAKPFLVDRAVKDTSNAPRSNTLIYDDGEAHQQV